jgi:hypothetical protein
MALSVEADLKVRLYEVRLYKVRLYVRASAASSARRAKTEIIARR